MEWIFVDNGMPIEGEYVFVRIDEWIGISRFNNGEWETGSTRRLPIFKKSERSRSSASPNYWCALPEIKE